MLALARAGLPMGLGLRVIDGYRTANRELLAQVLMTGATAAVYGPVGRDQVAR